MNRTGWGRRRPRPGRVPPRPRRGGAGLVALGSLLLGACAGSDGGDPAVRAGRAAYERYCALCHGLSGEGYRSDMANALGNPDFLASASDELLRTGTARGRPGTPMSPYGAEQGGPLSAPAVDAVVSYLRSWQTEPSVEVDAIAVEGRVARGQPLYEFTCARCHGAEGEGALYLSVSNPELLAVATDGFLQYGVAEGRRGTEMPAFDRTLTAQGIDDVVTLIRSWAKPIDDTPYVPPSHDLGDLFVNPGGPEPPFEPAGRFVGVDAVKQAIDAGQELALLDARPPSAYVDLHITGAVSVPSYAADSYLAQLPPDHWYVAYCGCPHSISGELYDFLQAHGYPKVKVLDEGFFGWQERGYPTTAGPEPY